MGDKHVPLPTRVMRHFYSLLWHVTEFLSDLCEAQALVWRNRYLSTYANPFRGRMVRWIETTGDMGLDKGVREVGVVISLYHDKVDGEYQLQPYLEVKMETGKTINMPLRAFYENPDDGVLEYRY